MNRAEALVMISKEVREIKKERGDDTPTPHVVLEIIRRHKTIKFSDLSPTESVPRILREMVEGVMGGTVSIPTPKDLKKGRTRKSSETLDESDPTTYLTEVVRPLKMRAIRKKASGL